MLFYWDKNNNNVDIILLGSFSEANLVIQAANWFK